MADVRELETEEVEEIEKFAVQSAAFLQVEMDASPKEIVTAINAFLRDIEDDKADRPDDDTVMGLGLLLAFQYTRELQWTWAYVTWEEGFAAHAITSPDHSLAITPIQWVNAISKKEATTNVLLNFNMIQAGNTPPAEPGACLIFQ
jgi:hypothetical protein